MRKMARSVRQCTCWLLLLAAAVLSTPAASKDLPPTLVVFGDSMTDNGNGWRVTNHTIPDASQGYYEGRFTNGPVWSDYLINGTNAAQFNIGYLGATACKPAQLNYGLPFYVPYLSQQFDIVASNAYTMGPRSAVIYMGLNDISTLAFGMLFYGLSFEDAMATVPNITACISETSDKMLRTGFTKSLILSTLQNSALLPGWPALFTYFNMSAAVGDQLLTNLGVITRAINDGIKDTATDLSMKYTKARVDVFDMYSLYNNLIKDGSQPDINVPNHTRACTEYKEIPNGPGIPGNTITFNCSDPDKYVWFDYFHPTTAVHKMQADELRYLLESHNVIFNKPKACSMNVLFHDSYSTIPDPANASSPYTYAFTDPSVANIEFSHLGGLLSMATIPYNQTLPNTFDHVKAYFWTKNSWKTTTTRPVLRYTLTTSMRAYNVDKHPFPASLITKPQDDLRLATCGLNAADVNTGMVTAFIMTNNGVYAWYERLPFARSPTNNYLAFSSAKHVASRMPDDIHTLAIQYDSVANTLSYMIGTKVVLFVDKIGYLASDPEVVALVNAGGTPSLVTSFVPNIGFGCLNFLDGLDYWKPKASQGLVRLDPGATYYTAPKTFYDDKDLLSNRMWGAGAKIMVRSFQVEQLCSPM